MRAFPALIIFVLTSVSLFAFQNCGPVVDPDDGGNEYVASLDPNVVVVDDMLLDASAVIGKGSFTGGGSGSQASSGIITYAAKKWPGGVIPVQFSNGITTTNRSLFFNACSVWASYSGLKCLSRTSELDYLYVTDADPSGCYTNVGAYGGTDPLSPYRKRVFNFSLSWCWEQQNLLHEIGHVLGLMHEHQRSDRDNYVRIVTENIQPGYEHAFVKFAALEQRTTYDYLSIMHYHPWSYSIAYPDTSKPTIVGVNGYTGQIGSATNLSSGDKSIVAQMYPKEVVATPTPSPTATPVPSPSPTPTPSPRKKRR